MAYSHTQKAPLWVILYGSALTCFAIAWLIGDSASTCIGLSVGLPIALLGPCFHHLTVEDQGEFPVIRFGPIPLFHRTLNYADLGSVEVGRTSLVDGWGVHYSIRGGWVWNLWGRSCVVVHFKNSETLWIGTDDAERLARFLKSKLAVTGAYSTRTA